jgi:DNA helicase-2/ATP-dependent DNA helicase PcrA
MGCRLRHLAVDGWFPWPAPWDDDELEEERRLMYVAMTRARDHLAVTYPLNAYSTRRGADYTIDQLSRFIDPGVRDTMQRVVPKFDDPGKVEPEAPMPLDLRELMRKRFGPS